MRGVRGADGSLPICGDHLRVQFRGGHDYDAFLDVVFERGRRGGMRAQRGLTGIDDEDVAPAERKQFGRVFAEVGDSRVAAPFRPDCFGDVWPRAYAVKCCPHTGTVVRALRSDRHVHGSAGCRTHRRVAADDCRSEGDITSSLASRAA